MQRIATKFRAQRLAWAVACSLFFFLAYGGTNWLASTRGELPTIRFAWEQHLPFVPAMIVPYLSIDLLFFGSFFLFADARSLRRHARRIVLAIAAAGACFVLLPLQMSGARPVVEGFWAPWFAPLHALDHPHNLVPSLHCALAALLLPAYVARTRGWLRGIVVTWFVLIAASTLLTYQHHVIDVVCGYALGLVVLWIVPEPFTRAARARRLDLSGRYGAASASFAVAAIMLGPLGWVLVWPALSCAILALAYAGLGAGVFRKRDGVIPIGTRALLLPYLIAARAVHRFYARHPTSTVEVAPSLVIGGRAATEVECVAVLDLTAECNAPPCAASRTYLNIPVLDLTPPTGSQLERAIRFIRAHANDGPVYVHCALGLSRSACVAAARLIDMGIAASAEDAVARVRTKRPQAVIDGRMLASLRAFARARQAGRSIRSRPPK